jgi:hypothetical protein
VSGLVIHYELAPNSASHVGEPFIWSDRQRDILQMTFIVVLAAGVGVRVLLLDSKRLGRFMSRAEFAGLTALTFGAGLTYFYGAHGARSVYPHLHDCFHYVLGPKYYKELGYDGLYACAVEALGPLRIPDSTPVRDLTSDKMISAKESRRRAACSSRFSPERWVEFQHDLEIFEQASPGFVKHPLRDRGYNGSPLHTFLASTITNAIPLSYEALSLMTLLDVFSVCAMLALFCHAFGSRLGLVCSVLFFSQYVDRSLIIGGSLLRYQWVAALGVGIACLRLGRYRAAGALLSVSAALNVFPVLFSLPILGKTAADWSRSHTLSASSRRFLYGALGAGALAALLGLAHAHGLRNYAEFFEAMRVHDAAGRAPGFGVGIKYDFLSSDFGRGFSSSQRASELTATRPFVIAAALALLAWVLALLRDLDDMEGSILFGFAALFCVFGPTGYYYSFAAMLVLMWHRRLRDPGGMTMLALLFALSVIPFVALLAGAHRFFVFNRVVSAVWTFYLLCALGYLSWRRNASP